MTDLHTHTDVASRWGVLNGSVPADVSTCDLKILEVIRLYLIYLKMNLDKLDSSSTSTRFRGLNPTYG